MGSDDPNSRPLACVALEQVRHIRQDISNKILSSEVPYFPIPKEWGILAYVIT
jgi:hypothetical protein